MRDTHIKFMKRALQLAACGESRVAPNPMVGAVVVSPDGKIIGEGFHAFYGGPHAEVNAIESIKESDRRVLPESTIYVTLEPCAHYGKTPPCANLIVRSGIKKAVIASPDPNPLVAGKGVAILKEAGIEVVEGVLRGEADRLNKRFMTFQTLRRPWILLKWAQSADGFIAAVDEKGNPHPVKFSNELSQVFMHRERSRNEAIMVGKNTLETDKPVLNARFWGMKDPKRIDCRSNMNLQDLMKDLYDQKISSLMVEGGPKLLQSFINENLFDEIRVETAPFSLDVKGLKAPSLPTGLVLIDSEIIRGNLIQYYHNPLNQYQLSCLN